MPFNTQKFMRQEYIPRTRDVVLLGLESLFDEGETPKFTVRGMTACEIAMATEASANKAVNIETILSAISNNEEIVNKLKEVIGYNSETPSDIKKRLEHLTIALIEPKMELNVAVKFAEVFPVEFYILTNAINDLTGMGMDIKK